MDSPDIEVYRNYQKEVHTMKDSNFYNPVRLCMGREAEKQLGSLITEYGKKVLLIYGGGSIKKNGVYDKVVAELNAADISYVELSGVHANPLLSKVYEGIELCRAEKVDLILAVGGGSVIDTAKAIGAGVYYEGDVWDFYSSVKPPLPKLVPVGCVLTIPAAGSECSNGTVIMNEQGNVKRSFNNEKLIPKFAILNPTFTFSLPAWQTACGVTDILSHFLERYFTDVDHVGYTDALLEASMRSIMSFGAAAVREPENYDARAEVMLLGTLAQSNVLGIGRAGDWGSHDIEHEMSAVFDVAHGAGLAVIFPAWMKYLHSCGVGEQKFVQFAHQVMAVPAGFGTADDIIKEGIRRLEAFLTEIGMPTRLEELNITADDIDLLVEKAFMGRTGLGKFKRLDQEDVKNIYRLTCKQ